MSIDERVKVFTNQRCSEDVSELALVVLDNLIKAVAVIGPDRRLLYSNSRFEELFGEKWHDRLGTEIDAQEPGETLGSSFRDIRLDDRVLRVRRAWLGRNVLVTADDVTKAVRDQLRAEHEARTDPLTLLGNRLFFQEQVAEFFSKIESNGGHGAVLMIDIDGFKNINDSFGHALGDDVLRLVADRIKSALDGNSIAARLGGDEFVVLQLDLPQPRGAEELAQRLVASLSKPFAVQGQLLHLGASIGIALIPDHGTQYPEIMRRADIALYRAKCEGRATHRIFKFEQEEEKEKRRFLELALRRALAMQEFALVYQPQLKLATNQITGFEALLRWNSPLCGYISPASFIPLAEELGLILPIGDWVMHRACREATNWPNNVHVAVNVSAVQFRGDTLLNSVNSALKASGLDPERLELEITESALLGDHQEVLTVLHSLRRRGVHVSMDDFGTGYSSLSYLRSFPFEKIKIDQAFVRCDPDDEEAAAILRAIASLGHALRMSTIAEGVETLDQLHRVTSAGCTSIQGYLISRPLAEDQIDDFLKAWSRKVPKRSGATPPVQFYPD
ncbi:MAG: EAL domain-containing protein [Hyphomicrobium sp.]|uniref:putative bifunctional diguanylate cyclase/phosphodiesterase n=1 Tax=Hyphomicrobium sp. TaxID=82 RepID=UPI0039E5EB0B